MRLMLTFFRAYPGQTFIMMLALLLAGLAEGIGLSAFLPFLGIAIRNDASQAAPEAPQNPPSEFEQVVIDALHSLGISPTIGSLLLIIVAGVTVKSLLLLIAQRQVGYTAAQVSTDLRLEMLRAILRSKWEFFLHQPIGRLSTSLASEAQRSSEAFVNGATVMTLLLQAIIYGSFALIVSWKATLVSLGAGLVIMLALHYLVLIARRAGKKQTSLLISLLSRLTDTLQSVKPLKSMAREHLADTVLASTTTKLNRALRKQVYSAALLNLTQDVMFTAVIAAGMYIALVKFSMPLATVVALAVALGKMLSQLGKVQKQYQKMVMAESAFWSLKSAITQASEAEEHLGHGTQPTLARGIRLNNIDFAYDQHPVLKNTSLEIPAGSLTTLIVPSGSGKTTVIDLVIGLLKPQSGEILIDGTPLSTLDLKAWRRLIGYVPQENLLLHDSILNNVTLGDTALTEDDAIRALKSAGAWEFIERLVNGIHTVVGERGSKLSGGQRQRIMIARALVNKPDLLILDEATSALDPDNEAAIGSTMRELCGELTILAISHQTALVKAADRVYRLGDYGATLEESPA